MPRDNSESILVFSTTFFPTQKNHNTKHAKGSPNVQRGLVGRGRRNTPGQGIKKPGGRANRPRLAGCRIGVVVQHQVSVVTLRDNVSALRRHHAQHILTRRRHIRCHKHALILEQPTALTQNLGGRAFPPHTISPCSVMQSVNAQPGTASGRGHDVRAKTYSCSGKLFAKLKIALVKPLVCHSRRLDPVKGYEPAAGSSSLQHLVRHEQLVD